jgi:hypothetical protein
MKSEQEIKQVLDNIIMAFNDSRDNEKSRIYSQAFNLQEIEALSWVLALDNNNWSTIDALERYNKNVKPRKVKQ